MCYAMFYRGFGRFVAGVLELIKGNTFGGTAFASYGAFWMGCTCHDRTCSFATQRTRALGQSNVTTVTNFHTCSWTCIAQLPSGDDAELGDMYASGIWAFRAVNLRWFLLELLMKQYPSVYKTALMGKTLWCGLWAFLTAGFFVVMLRKNGCLMTIFSTLVITFSLLAGGVWSESCELAAGYFGFFCGASAIYAAFTFLFKIELGIVLPGARPVNYLPTSPAHHS
ncbi:hypothetical protein VOLCADRAFT_91961 [Volvox carteri f. nagariensis]|uniref:Uncharacterized protein n=1 Tax=Volvox carteri f. nagariensis TaxID=3068 RepID=D8TYE6_VOLCA|nr:uncharacterized protein VOLCADRAFT_91961 [Volvox carteri f. nagariensis]EFJ47541.1 hypothetical protein VOLCADRAFT_91961 [Volvox carteri f. nagariensis]|eukprot:XP_002951365.1 hypothetical protein VOLCADRAFT_91961 [Volvox carteri f. nagariensis]